MQRSMLILSILLTTLGVEAATIYVDGNLAASCSGTSYSKDNRNCSGNSGAGYKTVPEGLRALRASDTLYIRGGNYYLNAIYGNAVTDTFGCVSSCPTSWETATKIMNYPNEKVVINHYGINMDNDSYPTGLSYLIWQGDKRENFIHQQNGTGGNLDGLRVNNAVHHIRFQSMTIRNFSGVAGINGGNSTNCTKKNYNIEIIDNEIRNNGLGETESPWEHGIYPSCGKSWLISRNYVVGNAAYGIHLNKSGGDATSLTDFIIERNIVEGRSHFSGNAAGIVITKGTGHIVRNNIIIGKGSQANKLTWGISMAWGVTGATVANNTIYDVAVGINVVYSTGVVIKNNLMNLVNDSIDLDYAGEGSVVTRSNNLCSNDDSAGGCSVVTKNPGFDSNFRLLFGSLAINAGETLSSLVPYDFDGLLRNDGRHDIGAFEYRDATAPAPSRPLPPKNLKVQQ
jgi:hypothetical protein